MKSKISSLLAATSICLTGGHAAASDIGTIGLAVPSLGADLFNQIVLGVQSYAAEKGINVVTVVANNDTAQQVSQIEGLIADGIDTLIYIPAGAEAAAVPTRLARAEGISVVNIDRFPQDAPGDTFIAGESVQSAYEVCNHIIGLAGGEGKIAIIHGQKGTTPELGRTEGCMQAIAENPGVELVAQEWSQSWSYSEGLTIASTMLLNHTDLRLIFGQADGLAMGAAEAVTALGLADQVIIGGYDGDMAALEYLSGCSGPFVVTATQSTQMMGRLAVDSAIAIAAGEPVPETQTPNAVLTTCENAMEFFINHP